MVIYGQNKLAVKQLTKLLVCLTKM